MSILNLFRDRGSAPLARERLQILLSHERTAGKQPDLLAVLHEEILATIARQITVERENVRVRIDRGATVSTLEIDVEIPHFACTIPASVGSNSRGPTERAGNIAMAMTNYESQWLGRVLRTITHVSAYADQGEGRGG
jgi:cell division topological specificity factor